MRPPAWLRPEHERTLAELVAALRRFGGALLADPVGSGKTFVALAVARQFGGGPVPCVVPAALAPQWRRAADAAEMPVQLVTHERLSRGPVAPFRAPLVLVDESHRFREATTRRHAHLADAVLRSRVLLLTATPVVNRLADLHAQLHLGVADDALAADGVPSLQRLLGAGRSHAAVRRLVIAGAGSPVPRPARMARTLVPSLQPAPARWLAAIDALALSSSPGVALLVRGVLWRALASSPASLLGALVRYDALLAHHADAAAGGRVLSRSAVLRATAGLDAQLLLWPMLDPPASDEACDLVSGDRPRLSALVADVRAHAGLDLPDDRLAALRAMLADARPTAVFTTFRESVRWLRERLGATDVAWCTGSAAGIGRLRLPRAQVLGLFGDARRPGAPVVLVASDVAAEGLDLRRLERVVHWDLPWTPARLEQRDGRAQRAGVRHATAESVRCALPAELEARVRLLDRLAAKAALPARAGLDGAAPWRRLADAARAVAGDGEACPGRGVLRGPRTGALAVFARPGDVSRVAWIDAAGHVHDDATTLAEVLRGLADGRDAPEADGHTLPPAIAAALRDAWRTQLAAGLRSAWVLPPLGTVPRRLLRRLEPVARAAAAARDATALARLDALRAFAVRGHTAGEARWLARLAAGPRTAMLAARPPAPRHAAGAGDPAALQALLHVSEA